MQFGKIEEFKRFTSDYVHPRNLDIWLPPGYDEDKNTRYKVIYMQDGQNLFDEKKAFNNVDWGVDKAMAKLMKKGSIEPAIIIGIWNTQYRMMEYMPQKPFEQKLPAEELKKFRKKQGDVLGDNYLKFLIYELKPFIDSEFRTKVERENTYLAGSSMGALIALYALCEYPAVFGGVACLSTHWPAVEGVIIPYLNSSLREPNSCKLYFDYGDQNADEEYDRHQRRVDRFLQKNEWSQGEFWITKKFEGADHSEESWRKRVHIPLEFLLKK